ncbi:MAG: A/G-specific adenine glycosylase, partial [Sandaracinobacteroides sp.]
DCNARTLPWRLPPGSRSQPDPYRVWLAEIMLQQTTVAAAGPYWRRFLDLWPTVAALAAADDPDVMREWAGLGYYARARNLLAAARMVVNLGGFPQTAAGLRSLPGIGPYTAAAVAAIAFGEPAVVIDANIERVTARLFALDAALPAGRPALAAALQPHVPAHRPGDFAQALMDLGSRICTPRAPNCLACPLQGNCMALAQGNPQAFPVKAAKRARPLKRGLAWWIEHDDEVALVRRPPRGLLGGMLALPGTGWSVAEPTTLPFVADWRFAAEPVRHGFTHFELELSIAMAFSACPLIRLGESDIIWVPRAEVTHAGLPTLFAKAAGLAIATSRQAETA